MMKNVKYSSLQQSDSERNIPSDHNSSFYFQRQRHQPHHHDEQLQPQEEQQQPQQSRRNLILWMLLGCILLATFLLGFGAAQVFRGTDSVISLPAASTSCQQPALRKEWRSLSMEAKREYLDAALCVTKLPSKLGLNQSLHHDFAWVHIHWGGHSHDASPFLGWHRYFIHAYEHELRSSCGYQGHLTYWDWTLDWEDLSTAPVWNSTIGFGGNGDKNVGREFVKGHCVVDGPFANLTLPYGMSQNDPHCLSRGFQSKEASLTYRELIKPESVETLLAMDNYAEFVLALEHKAHIAVPVMIGGDFELFSAPQDPLWFLHHVQVDRLWWRWQMRSGSKRMLQYNGKLRAGKEEQVSLTDSLPMGGLMPDITVSDIMQTEGDVLCYRY